MMTNISIAIVTIGLSLVIFSQISESFFPKKKNSW